ncbi:MAG: hypothetical protein CYPHOPRED_001575 [Cyphobasidiales sp. Tagirdzhanova-0007]|nr:MAG: hypothetical protein CYPHOPRED_001575 [Cyphobasidiales sp. Tagirdzhanova-0007]
MSPLMLPSYSTHSPGSSSQSSASSAWPAQSTRSLSSSSSSSSSSCSSSPETSLLNPPPQQPQFRSALPLYDQDHPTSSSTQPKQKKRVSFTGVAMESVSEPARKIEREGQGRETDSIPTRRSSLKWNTRVGSAIFELKLSQEEFMRRCYQPAAVYEATF